MEITHAFVSALPDSSDGTVVNPSNWNDAHIIKDIILSPGGRLTLTSATAITTTDVTGAVAIYYTPAATNIVPLYNGSYVGLSSFTELVLSLDAAYHLSGSVYDLFVIKDGSTLRLVSGPAWTSTTARSAALQMVSGVWTNASAIVGRYGAGSGSTVSVQANYATYVGSFCATANGAATDSHTQRLVFNAYNPAQRTFYLGATGGNAAITTGPDPATSVYSGSHVDILSGLSGGVADVTAQLFCANTTDATTFTIVQFLTLNDSTGFGLDSDQGTIIGFGVGTDAYATGNSSSRVNFPLPLGKNVVYWMYKYLGAKVIAIGAESSRLTGSVWM